ncbi:MAG: FkbM family methyltransferase [Ignavibacteriaceae bacterium]
MKTDLFWNFARVIKLLNGATLNFFYWMNSARSISSLELISGVKKISSSLGTIIDVGANKGQFAVASRLIFPDTTIICFEPDPNVFNRLKFNLKKLSGKEIWNYAVGAKDNQLEFWINDYDLASSFLKPSELQKHNFPQTQHQRSVLVDVKRLESLFESKTIKRPLLLKIDTQGFEKEVIKGAGTFLSQVDYLLLEISLQTMYEGEPLFDEINDYLRSLGFQMHTILGSLQGSDGIVLQIDAFYKRKTNIGL